MFAPRTLAVAVVVAAAFAAPAQAVSVLDIYACYACNGTGNTLIDAALTANPSVSADGLLLAFINTSGAPITNAIFSVSNAAPADSYFIGTIAAGATVIVMPGLSDDGAVHASGGLFAVTGQTVDTSESEGGVSDASVFTFSALSGAQVVSSGNILAGDPGLIRSYRDPGALGQTSFLGFGPDGDGGCNNCYYDKIAAGSINAVPEPTPLALYTAGISVLGLYLRRRKTVVR